MARGARLVSRGLLVALLTGLPCACTDDDRPTLDETAQIGAERLSGLDALLSEHETVTAPWHANHARTSSMGCPEGQGRWIGLATISLKAWNDDGDSPPIAAMGALSGSGWDTGVHAGDLDDDTAAAVGATPKGKNPAGLLLTITIERANGSWRYIVNLVSGCARY